MSPETYLWCWAVALALCVAFIYTGAEFFRWAGLLALFVACYMTGKSTGRREGERQPRGKDDA